MFVLTEIGFLIDEIMYGILWSDKDYEYVDYNPEYLAVITEEEDNAKLINLYNDTGLINKNDIFREILNHIEFLHGDTLNKKTRAGLQIYFNLLTMPIYNKGS